MLRNDMSYHQKSGHCEAAGLLQGVLARTVWEFPNIRGPRDGL